MPPTDAPTEPEAEKRATEAHADAGPPKGTLVVIGGAEDKARDMEILRRTIDEVRGEAKSAIVIAAASREPVEASRPYLRAFEELGIERVRPLDLQSRSEVEDERTLRRLEDADIIYFTGGDQVRLADVLRGSKALDVIRARYHGGAVVAGTSAGAAAMSATMIARGKAEEALTQGNLETSEGLGLLPGTVIDTHFVQRGRFGRLLEAITHNPDLIGLGIAEDTGFVLREGHLLEVIGSDKLIIVDGQHIAGSNKHSADEGEALSVKNALVHSLAKGNVYDLRARDFPQPDNKKPQPEAPVASS